jgi:magnesium-transporting ATPase (P-type)
LIVSVTAGNNYLRDQQFRKLNNKREQRDVNVLRNGEVIQLNVFNLLVGDIMMLSIGENIPVDGICLKSNSIDHFPRINL